jgi:hypothetical protein
VCLGGQLCCHGPMQPLTVHGGPAGPGSNVPVEKACSAEPPRPFEHCLAGKQAWHSMQRTPTRSMGLTPCAIGRPYDHGC